MITLYGPFELIESLTIDLRRALALGPLVVWETTAGEGERLVRVLRVRKVKKL